jgi:adenosine deaminase
VESAHEGETLHELQRLVRQRYADLGITIEVNPISNLLVGDLTDLTSHPLWRLAPKWGDQFGPSLRMCVGSDDPFPFATNLREEYQFLYDSLILAGKSPPEARDWLDLVRQMGWESRFTR